MKRAQDITEIKTLEHQGHYNPLTDDRHGYSQSSMTHAHSFQNANSSSQGTLHFTNSSSHSSAMINKNSKEFLKAGSSIPSEKHPTDKTTLNTDPIMTRFVTSKMAVEEPIPLDPENSELLARLLGAQDQLFENLDSFLDEKKMSQAQKEYSV